MTVQELLQDYNTAQSRVIGTKILWFGSVDEGDTLVIKDTIDSLTYDESHQATLVMFLSGEESSLQFESDITDEFSSGDTVAVTVHIINVTIHHSDSRSGQTFTIYKETFEEGWDAVNGTTVPFPRSTIEHAKDTDELPMTFYRYRKDYVRHVDTETRTRIMHLESFDEGDTVVIEDHIHALRYNATADATRILFASHPKQEKDVISLEGDITDAFKPGDVVTLTSDIINTTFTSQMQGETWTIHYETLADGWDTDTNTRAPFPPAALKHAIEITSVTPDKETYYPRNNLHLNVTLHASHARYTVFINVTGFINTLGKPKLYKSIPADLVQGDNYLLIDYQVPACTRCDHLEPGPQTIMTSVSQGGTVFDTEEIRVTLL